MARGYGGGNMNQMMRQMQKIQRQMEETQQKIDETVLEGSSGPVKVEMNGKREVLRVSIEPEAVDPDDVEMLEDMLVVAMNDALKQVQELSEREMGRVTGGLNIPGL